MESRRPTDKTSRHFTPGELAKLLRSAEGVVELVRERGRETDHLEFKREVNRNDPAWDDELRADAASLATAGRGFLMIGISDSDDGMDCAGMVVGVSNAVDLRKAVEDRLGLGLSPPITKRDAWIVSVPGRGDVVIVELRGTPGYPFEVLGSANPRTRYVVREAGKKKYLDPEEARLRRAAIDAKKNRRPYLAALLAIIVLLISIAIFYPVATDPSRQPVVTAAATLETSINRTVDLGNAGSDWSSSYTGDAGYVGFARGETPLIVIRSTRGGAKQTGPRQYRAVDYFDLSSPVSAVDDSLPIRELLAGTDRLVIKSAALLAEEAELIDGTLLITLNDSTRLKFRVPAQKTKEGVLIIPNFTTALREGEPGRRSAEKP